MILEKVKQQKVQESLKNEQDSEITHENADLKRVKISPTKSQSNQNLRNSVKT